ncbi:MAG: transposase [Leptolyngbyaceae cyanobacterium]
MTKQLHSGLRSEYQRRIEIMLLADAGKSQAQICEALNCSSETARYWIQMAQVGMAHRWDDRPMGRPKAIDQRHLDRLRELVEMHPKELGFPFQRWTAQWLSKQLFKEFGVQVSDRHVNRLLMQMGLSTRSSKGKVTPDAVIDHNSRITINDLQETTSPKLLWSLRLI